jgi:glycine cleavage system pyridoxal-binding protein P
MGYHNCVVPHPIMRNIFENPGWYEQIYSPFIKASTLLEYMDTVVKP